jgi:hypothetical protein
MASKVMLIRLIFTTIPVYSTKIKYWVYTTAPLKIKQNTYNNLDVKLITENKP